jgi:hypothetical protein
MPAIAHGRVTITLITYIHSYKVSKFYMPESSSQWEDPESNTWVQVSKGCSWLFSDDGAPFFNLIVFLLVAALVWVALQLNNMTIVFVAVAVSTISCIWFRSVAMILAWWACVLVLWINGWATSDRGLFVAWKAI